MRIGVLFAFFLLASGCLMLGDDSTLTLWTSQAPKECGQQLCFVDPGDPAARFVLETFGLHQLTDDNEAASVLSISDGLLAFSSPRITPQIEGHAVYAYDLKTGRFQEVAAGVHNHSYLPTSDGRRIVYSLRNATAPGPRVWDSLTGQTTPIDAVLGSDVKAVGFDYPWVALNRGFSSNDSEDGYWVYNLQDHRRVFLYQPYPRNQLPDKSYETILGTEIFDGTAAYILSRATPQSQSPQRYNLTVYTINLETGEQQEYYHPEIGAYRFSYGGRYVAIEAGGEAWSLDTRTGLFQLHSKEDCGFPSNGGSWIAFGCTETGKGMDNSYDLLVNVETGQRIKIQGHFHLQHIVTDGEYVVLSAIPNEDQHFSSFNLNLYWARISELKAA